MRSVPSHHGRITFPCEGHCPSWMFRLASLQPTHLDSVTASHCWLSSWDCGRIKSDSMSYDHFLFLDHKGNLTSNSRFSLKVVHGCCPPSHKVWQVGIPPHCWCSCLRNDCPIKTCSLIWICGSCRLVLVLLVCLNEAHLAYLFNEASVSLSFFRETHGLRYVCLSSFCVSPFSPWTLQWLCHYLHDFFEYFISLEFAKAASRLSSCLGVLGGRFLQGQSEHFLFPFIWPLHL